MGDLAQDIRYAARTLRASPTFTLVAVATLALGIGANTAIFSVVQETLLRPLPYRDPGALVVVGGELPGMGTQDLTASASEFRDYAERATTLESVAAMWPIDANLTSHVEPERVRVVAASANLFSVLGQEPILGRDFKPEDSAETVGGVGYVAVLAYDTWQRLFQGDPEAIGKTLRLDDDPITVIGVMPRDFEHPGESRADRIALWITVDLSQGGRFDQRSFRPFTVVGRLRDGASLETSRAELASVAAALRSEYPQTYPESSGWTVLVEPLVERTLGDVRPALLVLFAAVGLVLMTACANLASLLLTRGQGRGRELAIRVALGGGRWRLLRQLLTETLVLVLVGALAGMWVAVGALQLLRGPMTSALPRAASPTLDGTAFGFTLLLSLLAGLAFGLYPALQASRLQPQSVLRGGRIGGPGRNRTRNALATAQVAVSLMLVVGAGLLTRGLTSLMRVDPGFAAEGVLTVQTWLPIPNDPANGRFMTIPDRVGFVDRTLEVLREHPSVTDVAMTSLLPFRGLAGRPFLVQGREVEQADAPPMAEFRQVSPDYFRVMGIPLFEGRTFNDGDDASSPPVVIIDRTLSDRWFDGDAVGRSLAIGQQTWEIVGVVGAVREEALDVADRPHFYLSYRQNVGLNISFALKTTGDPAALTGFVRQAVRGVDPDQPVFGMASMSAVIADTLGRERLLTLLLGAFAALALALASVGIYGVVAYTVRQRHREIGIRLALGASSSGVLRLVLRDGIRVAGVGVAAGLVAALAASGVMSTVVRGVDQRDPATFATAAILAVAVALTASALPAWAATRVQPVDSIRDEEG